MTALQASALTEPGFPLLSLVVLFPAIAAIFVMTIKEEAGAMRVALIAAIIELILVLILWWAHDPDIAGLQFVETIPLILFSFTLGIDGISALFFPTTALLSLFAIICASRSVASGLSRYLAVLLFGEAALMGAFAATDLALFWLFFIAEIIPGYLMIKWWGMGSERDEVARNYLQYMALAALAIALGFLLLVVNVNGGASDQWAIILERGVREGAQLSIFILLVIGFAIKAPLFPFHAWMPKVLEHGPLVGVSIFLVGIKLGAYCFIRFVIPLLPEASEQGFWVMAIIGAISLVYGAMIALIQSNLRKLMGFASVSHMGIITLGLFSLNSTGIEGGILQSLNLGMTASGVFLIASFLATRLGDAELGQMGGLQHNAPFMSLGFLIIALSAVGMPGTSGFNGEHLILLGGFQKHWLLAVFVGIGPVLAAAYFLRYYQAAFWSGESGGGADRNDGNDGSAGLVEDLDFRERTIIIGLIGVVLWIGLYSTPFLSTMRGSVENIAQNIEASAPALPTDEQARLGEELGENTTPGPHGRSLGRMNELGASL